MSHRIVSLGCAVSGALFLLALAGTLTHAQTPPDTFIGPGQGWTPVNEGAFGLGTGADSSYRSEEGFEVLVYDGRLYVGMEADNSLGARLWRTRDGIRVPVEQSNWEEVAADGDGNPFGVAYKPQNDHIDSLAAFHGALYASTANRSGIYSGTLIYSSATGAPGSWTQVISAGFGDVNNQNFKDMVVFTVEDTDWLCGGTANDAAGAQVLCTADGSSWAQKNASGFGTLSNTLVASSAVFDGALYFGVCNPEGGQVWRTTDLAAWTQVFTATDRSRVEIAGSLDGYLYISPGAVGGLHPADPPLRLYRSATGDAGSWGELDTPLDDDPHNTRTIVDGAAIYNGALYLAVMNATTGVEVWRTADGSGWAQINSDGFGDAETFAAELLPFNGYLYAWTSNYVSGQQVLRAAFPFCQAQEITSTGKFTFPGVGARLNFSAENLDTVTVCVYPGAFPATQIDGLPLARHYEIGYEPAGGVFTAALTLSYTEAEFDASGINNEHTLYLARQEENGTWAACAIGSHNAASNTVTCHDVTTFSTWAIVGTPGEPPAVRLTSATARNSRPSASLWTILAAASSVGWLRFRQRRRHTLRSKATCLLTT